MKRAFRTTLFVVTMAVSYWVLFRVRRFLPGRAAQLLFDRAHAVFAGWFLDLATSLKGAIIKIGQVLSLRRDLLPRLWVERLSLLQDQVAPSAWTEIAPLLERHLERADELEVDPKALAAASYAQVHRARARDGRELVLKIRHPGLPQTVESDLRRLRLAMALFQRIVPRVDLAEVYEALSASLREELDFAHEGKKLERFRAQFEDEKWSWLRFPEVDWKHTSPEILALEYIPHPTLREAAPREPEKRREVFRRLSEVYYHSVFRHGFFHADPHPGNIMLAPDGSMVLLDFGMMGRVDREAARGLRTFLVGFVDRNVDLLLEGYRQLGILRHPADERLLRALFEDYLEAFREATPMSLHSQLDIAALHERSMQLVWQAKDLRFPFQIVLLLRAEGVIEGLAASLLPESTLVEALSPSLSDYREKGMDLVRAEIDESIAFWRAMPREIRGLFRQVRDGHFQVVTVTPSFDALGHNLFRLVRRVLFALAAFVFCWRATGLAAPRDAWGWASWIALGWSAFLLFRARYREG